MLLLAIIGYVRRANEQQHWRVMAPSRFLTTLRGAIYRAWHFNQCCVTSDLRNVHRAFGSRSILENVDGVVTEKKQRPKTVPVPKITLLSSDDSITVTVLEDAQRLAKRRKLTLVKISDLDSKTQRPVYKLMSGSVFLEKVEEDVAENVKENGNDGKDKQRSKYAKIFYISAKIADNDLLTKTKNMVKLLNKGHKVKIVVTLDGISEDKAHNVIEDAVKKYGSIQRMPSKKNVVLLISPVLSENKDNSVDNKKRD